MSGVRIHDLAAKEVLVKAQKDFESVLKDVRVTFFLDKNYTIVARFL